MVRGLHIHLEIQLDQHFQHKLILWGGEVCFLLPVIPERMYTEGGGGGVGGFSPEFCCYNSVINVQPITCTIVQFCRTRIITCVTLSMSM